MKAHIVTPLYDRNSNAIIARLARHLEKGNGWTVHAVPNSHAVVNVFIPYTEWRRTKWRRTLTAAWFTHKELPTTEGGACLRRWEIASRAVDLRVTPARMYLTGLMEDGRAVQISHPVELEHFTPQKHRAHKRPVIGVAGRVYKGGRKGEGLVKRLARDGRWKVIASGQGWPVPCTKRAWKDMPDFYRTLNIFLCTSQIEGGPVTVLEALACGVPVVIPTGVGAMDELPNMPGIWRYDKGDYDSMIDSINYAIDWPMLPEQLRAVVEDCTAARWCQQWQQAIERLVAEMA